jgi:hypothetical protein
MDVIIGQVFDSIHNYKPNTLHSLQDLTNSKCVKNARHYQQQKLAFAPSVAKFLGQFGADTLQLLWNLADHQAPTLLGFPMEGNAPTNLSNC